MVLQTEFAQIRNKTLYIDDVDAMDLVKQYGTPLYVMSGGHMRYQMNMKMYCLYLHPNHLVV